MGSSGKASGAPLTADPPSNSAVLEFRSVGFNYGPTRVLDDVTFSLAPGEMVALVGPSGAGKTTLLTLANGSLVATVGDVSTLGYALAGLPERRRRVVRADVGVVPQVISLPGALRVVHNVERVDRAVAHLVDARFVGLWQRRLLGDAAGHVVTNPANSVE